MQRLNCFRVAEIALFLGVGLGTGEGFAAEATVLFNRDVRPILAANCFQCHGPDQQHRQADLRLDSAAGIRHSFGEGVLDESEAWTRINSDDDDQRMPPPGAHRELKPKEFVTIRRWIEQGASYQGHWAFIPPQQSNLPDVKNRSWVRGPIDAFVLERLEAAGLSPSEEADRGRLLRRVTLDLTGLPPSLEQINAYLADASSDRYEKVVDRLLASDHFGERMALAWLDLARYGDTSALHADGPRTMWPWRDWVIRAYNNNKPFDEFTHEQLAGDLMSGSTFDQKMATAFLRNSATSDENGSIPEEFRVEYAVDRVNTTSLVWLGLTMECAQCHDHKFDPITQQDYYRIYDYFNQSADPGMQSRKGNHAPVLDLPNVKGLAKAATIKKKIDALRNQLAARKTPALLAFDQWLAEADATGGLGDALLPNGPIVYCEFDEDGGDAVVDGTGAVRLGTIQGQPLRDDGMLGRSLELDGENYVDLGDVADFERDQAFSYGAWIFPTGLMTGAAIARLNDHNHSRGFDLFLIEGNVMAHITHNWSENAIKVSTEKPLEDHRWQHVFITYDGSSKGAGIKIYIDGKPQRTKIDIDSLTGTIRTQVPLLVGRRHGGRPITGRIDDLRIYDRQLSELEARALFDNSLIAFKPVEQRTAEDLARLREAYVPTVDKVGKNLCQEIARLRTLEQEARKPIDNVMVMRDVAQPRTTYLLERGNYASPKKDMPLTAGVPAFLGPLPADAPPNRMGLAQWLTKPDHPLTARVAVNRYWYLLFGTGLVKTLEDFGSQGEWPSHPELLDWLAVDFIENGWDIKRMLKQIVMSATYRQSSRISQERYQRDPDNRLLARGPRFRLQAEFIRDNALAASGLLVTTIGGPGVRPYQPPGLWNEVSISSRVRFEQDHGEKLYRRSMYTYWKRSTPTPSMALFDAPSREFCTVRRPRTNTPLQALVTMNDPQFLEAARKLAERVLRQSNQTLEQQITTTFRLATGVRPNEQVLSMLVAAYAQALPVFQADTNRAEALLAIGESPRDANIDAAKHAAMTIVTTMILNLDETITRG